MASGKWPWPGMPATVDSVAGYSRVFRSPVLCGSDSATSRRLVVEARLSCPARRADGAVESANGRSIGRQSGSRWGLCGGQILTDFAMTPGRSEDFPTGTNDHYGE